MSLNICDFEHFLLAQYILQLGDTGFENTFFHHRTLLRSPWPWCWLLPDACKHKSLPTMVSLILQFLLSNSNHHKSLGATEAHMTLTSHYFRLLVTMKLGLPCRPSLCYYSNFRRSVMTTNPQWSSRSAWTYIRVLKCHQAQRKNEEIHLVDKDKSLGRTGEISAWCEFPNKDFKTWHGR